MSNENAGVSHDLAHMPRFKVIGPQLTSSIKLALGASVALSWADDTAATLPSLVALSLFVVCAGFGGCVEHPYS